MLLRPTGLPFIRVRGSSASQIRRGGLFAAKSQAGTRSAGVGKARRFLA